MESLGVETNGSRIRSVTVDTRALGLIAVASKFVGVCHRTANWFFRENASIVNEVPALQDTITKSCSLDLHLKVFRAHLVCDVILLRYYDTVHLLLRYRIVLFESGQDPRNHRNIPSSVLFKSSELIITIIYIWNLGLGKLIFLWSKCFLNIIIIQWSLA